MALSKKNRLKNKKDIDLVFKKGKSARGSFLFIKFLPSLVGASRVAIIVSLKTAGNAVARNKIRRVLAKVAVDLIRDFKKPYDLILLVQNKDESKDLRFIKTEAEMLIKKSFLIKHEEIYN